VIRGDVYEAALDPTKGSEQHGTRPVVIVSRDAINHSSPIVVIVPITGRENNVRVYPSQIEIRAGESGLRKDSVAMGEQVRAISKMRLTWQLGHLPGPVMAKLNAALKIALDLP
jgi:mRNA interferase MazF